MSGDINHCHRTKYTKIFCKHGLFLLVIVVRPDSFTSTDSSLTYLFPSKCGNIDNCIRFLFFSISPFLVAVKISSRSLRVCLLCRINSCHEYQCNNCYGTLSEQTIPIIRVNRRYIFC